MLSLPPSPLSSSPLIFSSSERDDLKHRCEELTGQLQELLERNRALLLENEEIPILRDSIEEMKYLESKVVSHMTITDSKLL